MADFQKAYAITMRHEGGYANHPADRGGMTYKGIARNFNPNWGGWLAIDQARKQTGATATLNKILAANEPLQKDVRGFYKLNYWDVNRLDAIVHQTIAEEVFDTGVNMGVRKAGMILQEALNLTNLNGRAYEDITVDGLVGPMTVALTNAHPRPATLLKILNALQAERYLNILRNNATQEVFVTSWFFRV